MPFLGGRGQAARGYFGGGTTPDAPTSLSSTEGDQQLFISFTPPAFNGGLEITNYEYATSTNGGLTYSSWAAISPADSVSPVTVSGLVNGTSYYVKLRAVNSLGHGIESTAVSVNTTPRGAPIIVCDAVTNFNQNRATFNATVNPNGATTSVKFQYKKSVDLTWTDGETITGLTGGSQSIYSNQTGLEENINRKYIQCKSYSIKCCVARRNIKYCQLYYLEKIYKRIAYSWN